MRSKPFNTLKKPVLALRDIVEVTIPAASFAIMFLTFVLQIFFRYVMRQPLQWAYEVTVSCYLWLVLLGACFAQRDHSHVVFTLLYDKLPLKAKAFTAFLGNLLIFVALVYSFIPSVQFVNFMSRQVTAVFKIGLNIIYAPYIPFLILMIYYALEEMIREFRVFAGLASEGEIAAFSNEAKAEYEDALEAALNPIDSVKQVTQ